MALFVALSILFFVVIPTEALAWGVGVHLQLGSRLLEQLPQLPAAVRALLQAFPNDFLYGCISADITIGKKFTHYLQHCHSWRMGKQILEAARTEAQQACAYGYLVHLAADTIAHSYFVPYKMIRTYNTVLLKHAYWEMRIEGLVDRRTWVLAEELARLDFSANDALLRSVLSDTIFSFETNKRLFNSLLLLNRLNQWHKMLHSLSRRSKWTLTSEDRKEYLQLAYEAGFSLLTELEQSPYWKADPTGERALNAARMIRKNLNLLWLDGKLRESEAERLLVELRHRLRAGITRPDQLLELMSAS